MPRQTKAAIYAHGEKKKQWQFTLTESCSQMIDALADELGVSRSELIERATRCHGLEIARNFDPETGECSKVA